MVSDPSEQELKDIIAKAQLHILPSFNRTGVKLKLLNALFNGRHCVVNPEGVEGTGLNELCRLAETAEDFKESIEDLYDRPFTYLDLQCRREKLLSKYDNHRSAEMLIAQIW